MPIAPDGCCAGHGCDGCHTCRGWPPTSRGKGRPGRCCRQDNPHYRLPNEGEWDGQVYGQIGVRNIVGDEMECHACGLFFRAVGPHAWQAHNLMTAEYRAIFGLTRKRGLMSDERREAYSQRAYQKWTDGVMDAVDTRRLSAAITPEQWEDRRSNRRSRMRTEERRALTGESPSGSARGGPGVSRGRGIPKSPDHRAMIAEAQRHRQRDPDHCIRGHLFSGENLGINGRGYRFCRTCKAETNRRQWRERATRS